MSFSYALVCMQTSCGQHKTGVDIFILTAPANSLCYGSFFQVATKEHMDPIEAKARALLLGAELARTLNLRDVNSLTDNEVFSLF
jgi:hypothetical protein